MKAIEELLDLLLPTRCALCFALGSSICENCAKKFHFRARSVTRGNLAGLVVTEFGSSEQLVIHAFKENGQTSLAGFLADPLVGPLRELTDASEIQLVVPVPSSRENYKKRGFMPTKVLAKRICRVFGPGCVVADSLIFKRKVEDQSRLDSNARRKNLEGSMLADSRVFGRQVILFDDVVTTGSTILEAGRAVELAGGTVIGFLAFAETILKTHSKF
jgi:ComF family protein